MAANKIELHIVTPEREFYTADVDRIVFKSTEGFIGVLYDHIPLITTLTSGTATFMIDKEEFEAVLHNGFAEIGEEKVAILTDASEWSDEIDIDRALTARERAEKRLAELSHSDEIMVQAEASLIRALARIELAQARQTSK
jgi:F-type H+-transporting ATPase subunit epsilon